MLKPLLLSVVLFCAGNSLVCQTATVGESLPEWKEGYLDLHHINTGWGSAAFYIFPDGTTMLLDAGEMDPTSSRAFTPRNAPMRPDYSKKPHQWIVHYIRQVAPFKSKPVIDYAAITHFHDDHFGSAYAGAPVSADGSYLLSGITGVGEMLPILQLMDRGYPSYDYPVPLSVLLPAGNTASAGYLKTFENYKAFVAAQLKKGYKVERFVAGTTSQVKLKNRPNAFPSFQVRGIKVNGTIWTGKDTSTYQHFGAVNVADRKTWPDENSLSLALTIRYGPFKYYSGGDNPGNLSPGDPEWRDVETPMAKAIGEVDVATLDHHGNRDAVNANQVKTFKPRVWIGQSWSSDHPGHEVLIRMTTPFLYEGERDLFATNMLESNRNVIGPLIDRAYKSTQGHIVVRVLPGGKTYYVIILDDSKPELRVKAIYGPYTSKEKLTT